MKIETPSMFACILTVNTAGGISFFVKPLATQTHLGADDFSHSADDFHKLIKIMDFAFV